MEQIPLYQQNWLKCTGSAFFLQHNPQVRGRVAIIIADNLKTHTAQGSLLVRSMLTELSTQLSLVYTPAYDPDANRIEWRCAYLPPHRYP